MQIYGTSDGARTSTPRRFGRNISERGTNGEKIDSDVRLEIVSLVLLVWDIAKSQWGTCKGLRIKGGWGDARYKKIFL